MKQKSRNGFTLVELLLAMSLLVLLVSALVGGLQFGRRVWERGSEQEANTEFEAAVRAVGNQFAAALPVSLSLDGFKLGLAFEGRSDSCRFVTLGDGAAQTGGPTVVEIGLSGIGAERALEIWTKVFRIRTYSGATRENMRRTRVLHNVIEFKITYFGSDNADGEATWRDAWTQGQRLPLLVSLHVAVHEHGRRRDASVAVPVLQR